MKRFSFWAALWMLLSGSVSSCVKAAPADAERIEWAPGATVQELVDQIPAGTSKSYLFQANAGQQMAISYWAENDARNQTGFLDFIIIGPDGQQLCPVPDGECHFWRGRLPASGDYTITATPSTYPHRFKLRVALSPARASEQLFSYQSQDNGFTVQYPDYFSPADGSLAGHIPLQTGTISPEFRLMLIESTIFATSNLSSVHLTIGSSAGTDHIQGCLEPGMTNPERPEHFVNISDQGGYSFHYFRQDGVAAGHQSYQHIYRTVRGGRCFELVYHIHAHSIPSGLASVVRPFSEAQLLTYLNTLFNGLTLP